MRNTLEIIETVKKDTQKMLYRFKTSELALGVFIAAYFIIFLWGFFSHGTSALGINMTIFHLLIMTYFLLGVENKGKFFITNFYWIIPYIILVFSFSIYDNPYLKTINLFLLPVVVLIFLGISLTKFRGNHFWSASLFVNILGRSSQFENAANSLKSMLTVSGKSHDTLKKLGIGVMILVGLNTVIIPLLVIADENFSSMIGNLFGKLSFESIFRILIFFLVVFLLVMLKLRWTQKYTFENKATLPKRDGVIAGVVLLGTLGVYLLFIFVQLDTLFYHNVAQGVEMVSYSAKSGFWQLFIVSIINIVIFFVFYKTTPSWVQVILSVFILSSMIILLSAGYRMYNYVSDFGLSYEKFVASYTVIYFGVLFCIMFGILYFKKRVNIVKVFMVLALGMYAFLNIIPMEKIIFNVNTNISQQPNATINPYQSHILSSDITSDVLLLKEENRVLFSQQDWKEWLDKKKEILDEKKWYEKSIGNFR